MSRLFPDFDDEFDDQDEDLIQVEAGSGTGLSLLARLICQIHALFAPMELSASEVASTLNRAGFQDGSRKPTAADVRSGYVELDAASFGYLSPGGQIFSLYREYVIPITRESYEHGRLDQLLASFKPPYYSRHQTRQLDFAHFRAKLITGRDCQAEWRKVREGIDTAWWDFIADPFDKDLYLSASPDIRLSIATGCLNRTIEEFRPMAELVETIENDIDEIRLAKTHDIALIRVLQGRFDLAEKHFDRLPESIRSSRTSTIGRESIRGLIQALKGNDIKAKEHIERVLELCQEGSPKKLVYPKYFSFQLSLVSLVRSDSVANLDLLKRLDSAFKREEDELEDLALVQKFLSEASFARQNGELPSELSLRFKPSMVVLLDLITHTWFPIKSDTWRILEVPIQVTLGRVLANDYAWVAAEYAVFLRRAKGLAALRRVIPEEMNHEELGTVSLSSVATPLSAWEVSFRSLEQLAFNTSKKTPKKKKSTATPGQRRIVWDLESSSYLGMTVTPREQTQQKSGRWGKGRRMTPSRFQQRAGTWDFLLPQDRAVASVLTDAVSGQGRRSLTAGPRALAALAGHPHVFGETGENVEVVLRQPELVVEKYKSSGYLVKLKPTDNHDAAYPKRYVTNLVTKNRLEVTHFTSMHLQLLPIIPKSGLKVPNRVKDRLLEAIAGLSSETRVQSEAAGHLPVGTSVDADAEPWVLLERYDAGLSVAVVVEPIANSDMYYQPGTGGATVFANRDGQSFQTNRSLEQESKNLSALIDACPKLGSDRLPTEQDRLLLPELIDCLEMLESLRVAEVRCKWPKGDSIAVISSVSTPSLNLRIKTAEDWLQASGTLNLDDEGRLLDLRLLLDLMDAKAVDRFVEIESGQFLALSRTFQRQLESLKGLTVGSSKNEIKVHRAATPVLEDLFDETELDGDSAFQNLQKRIQSARSFDPQLPSTLAAELRPYQVEGYRWLARLAHWGAGACLADDMGLGKTLQSLALLLDRANQGPALVVVPTSVVANWLIDATRFAPTLSLKNCTGSAANRSEMLESPKPFDLYVTTYGLLVQDIEKLATIHWHSVILDEAQAIKNPLTKRARAAKRLLADFRLVTTGTPVQNNVMDLYSLFSFLNPGLLGSTQKFQSRFADVMDSDKVDVSLRLRRMVSPFMLRRLKSQVLEDLPERTEITRHVKLSEDEAAFYEAIRLRAIADLESVPTEEEGAANDGASRIQILAVLTKLRLACCHPKLVKEGAELEKIRELTSAKLETFADMVHELIANKHKVLVFSQFVKFLKLAENTLQNMNVKYQYLDGSTPQKARQDRIDAFQSGEGDVFLISLKAGGTGLNLTAADYVIHMDPWWNPAVEDQASDRAHRIGQTRPVTIYRLVAEGTIEEQIVDLHHHKRSFANRLLEDTDSAAQFTAEELLELIKTPLQVSE